MRPELFEIGHESALRRALGRHEQPLPRLPAIREHEHQTAAQVATDASEHRFRDERGFVGQRFDERRETMLREDGQGSYDSRAAWWSVTSATI